MQLSKHIFWDVGIESIDFEKHTRFVIERVITHGSLADWHLIKKYYGLELIKKEALMIRSLTNKNLNFLSRLFNIPKQEFRCYKQTQSAGKHWNY